METDISAAILAGGSAKRLGGIIKPAVIVGGQTILSRMLSVLGEIFSRIIVVSNSDGEFFRQNGLEVIPDIIPGSGPLGGIHAALQHPGTRAVFAFAGDMPFLEKSIILEQIGIFKKNSPAVLVPKKGNLIEPLHSIYSRSVAGILGEYLLNGRSPAVRDFLKDSGAMYYEPKNASLLKKAFLNINSPADIVIAEEALRINNS